MRQRLFLGCAAAMAVAAVMGSSSAPGAVVFGFNADGNAFDGTGVGANATQADGPVS